MPVGLVTALRKNTAQAQSDGAPLAGNRRERERATPRTGRPPMGDELGAPDAGELIRPHRQLVVEKTGWSHDSLLVDLIGHLRTAEDYVVGEPTWGPAGSVRPDVLRIRKSYTRIDIQVYEVKSNRPDFLAEMRTSKWREYIPRCTRMYFATPLTGVIRDKSEVPEACGWIARSEHGWRTVVTPRIREVTPTYNEVLALLMNCDDRVRRAERQVEAARKIGHFYNVRKNKRLCRWMDKLGDLNDNGRKSRKMMVEARHILEEATGLQLGRWHYGWQGELRAWARDRAAAFPTKKVEGIIAATRAASDRLKEQAAALEREMGSLAAKTPESVGTEEESA